MQVWHMSGAGNDFAVVDIRSHKPDLSALALRLCSLLGADGLMALDTTENGDLRIHFYNSDGSRGEMCGNGTRCISRFAYDQGLAGSEMTLHADAGLVKAWRLAEDLYRLELNVPSVLDLHRTANAAYVELGDPGIPHAVVELPALEWAQREALRPLGISLRHDPAFPKGVNVNFFTRLGAGEIRVLTYERGVEDYTLACGTGCASIASVLFYQEGFQGKLTAHNPGGVLTVTLTGENKAIQRILLEGPVTIVKIFDI